MNVVQKALKILMDNPKNEKVKHKEVVLMCNNEDILVRVRDYMHSYLVSNPKVKYKFTHIGVTIDSLGSITLVNDNNIFNLQYFRGSRYIEEASFIEVGFKQLDELYEIKGDN